VVAHSLSLSGMWWLILIMGRYTVGSFSIIGCYAVAHLQSWDGMWWLISTLGLYVVAHFQSLGGRGRLILTLVR
jgi:hypothetical protein